MIERTFAVQGCYFLVTGVWPLVHYPSFAAVTGPKRDVWLVKTVGALIAAIAVALFAGAHAGGPRESLILLAAASAFALGVVDVHYVRRGIIRRIYLIDAAIEFAFVAAWLFAIA